MLRPYLGNIGHLATILAFVSALAATYAYWQASRLRDNASWIRLGRRVFYFHTAAITVTVLTLFSIILNNYFEYHYAWDNTSVSLPKSYAISAFWQDQEGSFLLWMFWDVLVGIALIAYFIRKKAQRESQLEAPTLMVFSAVQGFLASMILGVVLWGDFKLGSSPFLLLRESMPDIPVWKTNPDFVPTDGNGLNPLLQNYWMVIHPPTLFLGFALTLVPFALAIAALWRRQFAEWVKPAMPWSLVAAVVLGGGIMMGAIWAYETLNFGGYWNWDPVENAVYVPWLILVAAFHTMLISHKSTTALKYSFILSIAQFVFILYSTFLTRSGILGNASVHSFTDLGLSGQLLLYLLTFLGLAIVLAAVRWKEMPTDQKEVGTYTPEFWVFIGVILLLLAAFQVIVTTSIPVYNKIAEVFGTKLNMALPADQVKHYTDFQLWFFVIIVPLTGVAQYFWWKRVGKDSLTKLANPLIVSLFLASAFIFLAKVNNWKYIIILTTSLFAVVANLSILFDITKAKWKVSGGAVTHIGVALMLMGIMFSSGYSKVISLNSTGQKIFEDADKENRENVILWLNRPTEIEDFKLTYKGQFVDIRNVPGYIEKRFIQPLPNSTYKAVMRTDLMDGERKIRAKGDTVEYEFENTYYQVVYQKKGDTTAQYNLYPRFQQNQQMGNVKSPDIKKFWNRDIYTHVTFVSSEQEREWSPAESYTVALKDTFFLNDYVAILDAVQPVQEVDGLPVKEGEAAAQATVRILERDGERILRPVFAIRDREVWSKPEVSDELGLRMQLLRIDPATGQFTFGVSRGQREFIVLKALEKPHINLLWIGTALLCIGITIAAVRRFR